MWATATLLLLGLATACSREPARDDPARLGPAEVAFLLSARTASGPTSAEVEVSGGDCVAVLAHDEPGREVELRLERVECTTPPGSVTLQDTTDQPIVGTVRRRDVTVAETPVPARGQAVITLP